MLFCLCADRHFVGDGATIQHSERGSWDGERDQSWYQQPTTYQSDTRAIIQQKAQVRAAQRDARLASLQLVRHVQLAADGRADAVHDAVQPGVANAGRPAICVVSRRTSRRRTSSTIAS